MMEYIVDMQGFQQPINEFVVKEIAIMDTKSNFYVSHVFEPPCTWESLPPKYKCTNNWLTRNYHNLTWNQGYFPYNELKHALKSMLHNASCIYVKGSEKKMFLNKLLNNKFYIINVNDVHCPSLKNLSTDVILKCPHHFNFDSKYQCALKNVQLLKSWIVENSFDE